MPNSPRSVQRNGLRVREGSLGPVEFSWKSRTGLQAKAGDAIMLTKKSTVLSMEDRLSLIRMLWWLQTIRPTHPRK